MLRSTLGAPQGINTLSGGPAVSGKNWFSGLGKDRDTEQVLGVSNEADDNSLFLGQGEYIDEDALMSSWFFEGLPPSDTFEALAAAEDGAYVVHSGAPAEGATYTLNAVYGQHITATPIYIEPDGLRLGEAPETHMRFSCISDLVRYYAKQWKSGDLPNHLPGPLYPGAFEVSTNSRAKRPKLHRGKSAMTAGDLRPAMAAPRTSSESSSTINTAPFDLFEERFHNPPAPKTTDELEFTYEDYALFAGKTDMNRSSVHLAPEPTYAVPESCISDDESGTYADHELLDETFAAAENAVSRAQHKKGPLTDAQGYSQIIRADADPTYDRPSSVISDDSDDVSSSCAVGASPAIVEYSTPRKYHKSEKGRKPPPPPPPTGRSTETTSVVREEVLQEQQHLSGRDDNEKDEAFWGDDYWNEEEKEEDLYATAEAISPDPGMTETAKRSDTDTNEPDYELAAFGAPIAMPTASLQHVSYTPEPARRPAWMTKPKVIDGEEVNPRPTQAVRFEADSNTGSPRRDIWSFVDAAAAESVAMVGHLAKCSPRDLLAGEAVGGFVMYRYKGDDAGSKLGLSLVLPNGVVDDYCIKYDAEANGIRLYYGDDSEGGAKVFPSLGELLAYYASDNTERPRLLNLPITGQHLQVNWMHPTATRERASHQVMMRGQDGTFVVRCSRNQGVKFVVTYVYRGAIYHSPVIADVDSKSGSERLGIEGASSRFSSIGELVDYYTSRVGQGSKDLRCILKRTSPIHMPSVVDTQLRPPWLRPDVEKGALLTALKKTQPGMFVIRQSWSQAGALCLSYSCGSGVVAHENLVSRKAAGGTRPAYALRSNISQAFGSLTALVRYYSAAGRGLQFPLISAAAGTRGTLMSRMVTGGEPLDTSDTPNAGKKSGKDTGKNAHRGKSAVKNTQAEMSQAALVAAHSRGLAAQADAGGTEHRRVDPSAAGAPWCCLGMTKEAALARLPKRIEGAFVIRDNAECFATLSMIVGGRIYSAHLLDTDAGLICRRDPTVTPAATLSIWVSRYMTKGQHYPLPCTLRKWWAK